MKRFAVACLTTLFLSLWMAPDPARGCGKPPVMVKIVIIKTDDGPPLKVKIVYDSWSTFGAGASQFCSCAFKLPTGLIETVDQVRFTASGTDILIPGFDSWSANSTTTSEVTAMSTSALPGFSWFGFSNNLSGVVTSGVASDFQVLATLKPGVTVDDLVDELSSATTEAAFADEASSIGIPLGTEGGFVDAMEVSWPVELLTFSISP